MARIKKHVFDAISRELKNTDHPRSQADIAADYQVSSSTVSAVNLARTWGNFRAGIRAKSPLRSPVRHAKPSRFEKAQKAGLNPVTLEQRIEDRFERELTKIAETYEDRSSANDRFKYLAQRDDSLQERQDVALDRIRASERSIAMLGWAVTALAVAVVLVIIFK